MYLSGPAETNKDLALLLAQETKLHEGYFSESLAGKELIRDNDNFSYALVEQMPAEQVGRLIQEHKIPQSISYEYQKVFLAMVFSSIANTQNISLRQELVRVSLSNALVKATSEQEAAKLAGLGFFIIDDLIKLANSPKVHSLSDYFRELGRSFGKNLRRFGNSVLSIREFFVDKWGVLGRYFSDFIVTTPGGKFFFGDLARELGVSLELGKQVSWEPIAAGGAQYLKDMSTVLKIVGIVAPPPWNLICKVVAIVYQVGSKVIEKQLAVRMQAIAESDAKLNEEIRATYEKELEVFFGHLAETIPPSQSEFGSNSTENPSGGSSKLILLVGAGILALFLLGS